MRIFDHGSGDRQLIWVREVLVVLMQMLAIFAVHTKLEGKLSY